MYICKFYIHVQADNMVPFQVIEVVNIPDTLQGRFQSRDNSAALHREAHLQSVPVLSQEHPTAVPAPSKLVRTKYGAWYLPPRSWKLRKKDEVSSRSCCGLVLLRRTCVDRERLCGQEGCCCPTCLSLYLSSSI